jgi:hypothetical protein
MLVYRLPFKAHGFSGPGYIPDFYKSARFLPRLKYYPSSGAKKSINTLQSCRPCAIKELAQRYLKPGLKEFSF